MRKVWTSKRNGVPGVYVEWIDDSHKRKSKYFSPDAAKYAEKFRALKYAELNCDIVPVGGAVDIPWSGLVWRFLEEKELRLRESSLVDLKHALKVFQEITKVQSSKQLTDAAIRQFIKARRQQVKSENTVRKNLSALRTLVIWGKDKGFVGKVEVKLPKYVDKEVYILNDEEIQRLLKACGDDPQWRMRILLALCTGMRRSTLNALRVADFDLPRKAVSYRDVKTGKLLALLPLPDALIPELQRFLDTQIASGQVRFFKHNWSKRWFTILEKAGFKEKDTPVSTALFDFHDLRRTFASKQADAGVPITVVQAMLQHADIKTTMKHYVRTNNTAMRDGVNKLDFKSWVS